MGNKSKNKKNQVPAREGKKQIPRSEQATKLDKRSEVMQVQRNHPELNYGTNEDETASSGVSEKKFDNPERKKPDADNFSKNAKTLSMSR